MGFWLKHIILGLVIIGLGVVFLIYQDDIFGKSSSVKTTKAKQDAGGSTRNKAAEGLSRFYASINPEVDEQKGPVVKNHVVYLPEPSGNIDNILDDRSMVVRPIKERWKGSTTSRPFRKGDTLFQKLSEYANDEGIEILWRLNRDFVIKDSFRIEKSIIDTALQVGHAVSGHFENGVSVFFCNKQRAIIFISGNTEYLEKQCQLLQYKSNIPM